MESIKGPAKSYELFQKINSAPICTREMNSETYFKDWQCIYFAIRCKQCFIIQIAYKFMWYLVRVNKCF